MNVRELMELLKDIPPETPVMSPFHDWVDVSDCSARLDFDGETVIIEAADYPTRPTREELDAQRARLERFVNPNALFGVPPNETFKQWRERTGGFKADQPAKWGEPIATFTDAATGNVTKLKRLEE